MIPSKIKIESFAKRCHMGTLGGKGLTSAVHISQELEKITTKLRKIITLTKNRINLVVVLVEQCLNLGAWDVIDFFLIIIKFM